MVHLSIKCILPKTQKILSLHTIIPPTLKLEKIFTIPKLNIHLRNWLKIFLTHSNLVILKLVLWMFKKKQLLIWYQICTNLKLGKGKAFSYFSIIAKHYLIALNNSTYKRRNQHVEISEEHDENTVQLQTEDKHYKDA